MTTKINAIDELRSVVNDDTLPITARRDAAVHLVALKTKAVDLNVPDDDPEVVALRTPWPRMTESEVWLADSWGKVVNTSGWSLLEAKAEVADRWAFRAQLAAVIDTSLPHLERLETVRVILTGLSEKHHYRYNNYSVEHLLTIVNSPTDERQYSDGNGFWSYRPISIPPLQLDDVFDGRKVFPVQVV